METLKVGRDKKQVAYTWSTLRFSTSNEPQITWNTNPLAWKSGPATSQFWFNWFRMESTFFNKLHRLQYWVALFISVRADFSLSTMEALKWKIIFSKCWKKRIVYLIVYLVNISFKNEGKMKTFSMRVYYQQILIKGASKWLTLGRRKKKLMMCQRCKKEWGAKDNTWVNLKCWVNEKIFSFAGKNN